MMCHRQSAWLVSLGIGVLWGAGAPPPAQADDLPAVSASPGWELSDRKDDPHAGYVIYTRKPFGSDYAAYRLEADLPQPPGEVADAAFVNLTDPDESPGSMKKEILSQDDRAALIYSYIPLPLVADRDVTTRGRRSYEAGTGTHRIAWQASDAGPPEKPGVVRLDRSAGSWTFSPNETGGTHVVYESHTETAGSIPAWLVNSMMTDTVVDGYESLLERLAAEKVGEADEPAEPQ